MPQQNQRSQLPKGEVFDRPPFEMALDWLWQEFESAKLAFDDVFKDATRHDQVQLYDSMIARGSDFLLLSRSLLATKDEPTIRALKTNLMRFKLNEGTMLEREGRVAQAIDYVVGELHRAGYIIAQRKRIDVASDFA